MYLDKTIGMVEVADALPQLTKKGIDSFATSIGLRATTINQLNEKQLVRAILEELNRRGQTEIGMRYYADTPIGVPIGIEADIINSRLRTLGIDLDAVETPFTTIPMEHLHEEEIEMLPRDVFKIGYGAWIDTLDGTVYQSAFMKRMVCTNKAMVTDKHVVRHYSLERYTPFSPAQMDEAHDELLRYIRRVIIHANETPVNAEVLLNGLHVAQTISAELLELECKKHLNTIASRYHLPKEITKVEDISRFPKSWKETATLKDVSVYKVWNDCTSAITKSIEAQLLTPETALASHIAASKLLVYKQPTYDIAQLKR
jgi:hypothetical protein